MLRNYLAAALRNLARNRLHAAITTLSLAIGFAAVIVATLFWRYEHSYDRFWPDHERTYMAVRWVQGANGVMVVADTSPSSLAPAIEQGVAGVEHVSRLAGERMRVTRGETEAMESGLYWADLNFFSVIKPKVVAGDLGKALAPGNVVLTRSLAEKYFGRPDPLGETLTFTRSGANAEVMPMRVTGIIEDIPENSHLDAAAFIAVRDRSRLDNAQTSALTYMRVRGGVTEEALAAALKSLSARLPPVTDGFVEGRADVRALPLRHVWLRPGKYSTNTQMGMIDHGSPSESRNFLLLGALILAIAAINFVTLMTARGARRAVEVGVRKAAGARRRDLVIQFMGEGLVYTGLALLIGLALVEFILPLVAANTQRTLSFTYFRELPLIAVVAVGAILVGLAAGLYPALALSGFKPASVLKGGLAKTPGSARLRQILIGLQFTPLVLLAIGAVTLGLQANTRFENSMKMLDPDALIVREPCTPPLKAAFESTPGVRGVTCLEMSGFHSEGQASAPLVGTGLVGPKFTAKGKELQKLFVSQTDREGMEFHGLAPVAGRLWSGPEDERGVVINEDLARDLGFARPQMAVGQNLEGRKRRADAVGSHPIIGVVPNRGGISGFEPAAYFLAPPSAERNLVFGLTLTDPRNQATLAALDAAFAATGARQPLRRQFYRDQMIERSAGSRRDLQFLFAWVGLGVIIATFGLFGLSAFLAEQRTKEMGVRKALGAGRGRLLNMLVFQFARPVLVANLIAIPAMLAFNAFSQRGEEVAERYTLGPEVFLPVIAGSILVAFIATFGHAWQVTGARPVTALRYE